MIPVITIPFMSFQLLGMESKTVKNTGLSEILGELTGGRVVSSEYAEEPTTLTSRAAALGLPPLTHGLRRDGIQLLKQRKAIQTTILLYTTSHSQNSTLSLEKMSTQATIFSEHLMEAAESRRLGSQMEKSTQCQDRGRS